MDLFGLGVSELIIVTLTCLCIGAAGVGAFGLLIWLTSRGGREFEQNLAEFEQSDEG
jgi:hypothetical protein